MPEERTSRTNPRVLWTIAVLLLIAIFFGVRRLTRSDLPIRVAQAERQNLVKTVSTNGKVEPQQNFEAHAPMPGVIQKLYVHAGDVVPKGKLLLAMDDRDAASREASALAALRGAQASYQATEAGGTQEEQLSLAADLKKAQMERDQAQQNLEALKKLQAQGAASPSEVASAQQRLDQANANLANLQERKTGRYAPADITHSKATLAEAQAGYSAAAQTVSESNVRAPFAGTVYSVPVSQSEYVQQGQQLLQMADLKKLQVRAYFDEPEIGGLKVGQPATIIWDALHGRTWHGHIIRVPATIIGYGTRNVGEVLVSIDDANGDLLPNTNVTVTITEQRLEDVLTVPREALHSEAGQNFVYRLNGSSLRRTPVVVGTLNLTQVQITSGLKEHDVVALRTTNGEPLSEGVPVQIIQ